MASVMSALPVWRLLDPLAVLESRGAAVAGNKKSNNSKDDSEQRVRDLFE